MTTTALISIICEDHPGLIADVTGRLFDLGVNLGDTTFAVLGGGAEPERTVYALDLTGAAIKDGQGNTIHAFEGAGAVALAREVG